MQILQYGSEQSEGIGAMIIDRGLDDLAQSSVGRLPDDIGQKVTPWLDGIDVQRRVGCETHLSRVRAGRLQVLIQDGLQEAEVEGILGPRPMEIKQDVAGWVQILGAHSEFVQISIQRVDAQSIGEINSIVDSGRARSDLFLQFDQQGILHTEGHVISIVARDIAPGNIIVVQMEVEQTGRPDLDGNVECGIELRVVPIAMQIHRLRFAQKLPCDALIFQDSDCSGTPGSLVCCATTRERGTRGAALHEIYDLVVSTKPNQEHRKLALICDSLRVEWDSAIAVNEVDKPCGGVVSCRGGKQDREIQPSSLCILELCRIRGIRARSQTRLVEISRARPEHIVQQQLAHSSKQHALRNLGAILLVSVLKSGSEVSTGINSERLPVRVIWSRNPIQGSTNTIRIRVAPVVVASSNQIISLGIVTGRGVAVRRCNSTIIPIRIQ